MRVYCTYCSAEKDMVAEDIPAIQRYKSSRISRVKQKADSDHVDFFILSGKFGLLSTRERIPYYDHLLIDAEVDLHSDLVAKQLVTKGISELVFYSRSLLEDPYIQSYSDCIRMGCDKAMVSITFAHVSDKN